MMQMLAPHFANKNASWEYEEIDRVVDGCRTAYVLYRTWYGIPSIGYRESSLTGITLTYTNGRWLVVADQNTGVPVDAEH